MSLSPEIIEQIRERITLSELIGETVQLKRAGRNLLGLCPFHNEKSPSFSVNDEEGFYHCFGCGKHGSAFDFVMESRGYSFREAASFLASRAGVVIPESQRNQEKKEGIEKEQRRELGQILAAVTDVFHQTLTQQKIGEPARSYLERRGLKAEIIGRFRLGYAPNSWDFILSELKAKLFGSRELSKEESEKLIKQLQLLGLLKAREKEAGCYDAFRGRIIFPITRSDGCTIAFGGRIIQESADAPKYINSSEHPLYAKRRTFYGLSQALPTIRQTRHVYVVEGYMDVLSLVQAGIGNVVATCGTAMTEGHVQIVKRFVDRVSLVFDGDAAGQKAAARCFPLFLNSGIEVSAVVLPRGEDPDSVARNSDAESIEKVFSAGRKAIVDVFIDELFAEVGELGESSPAVTGKLAGRFAQVISGVENSVEQEFLLKRGAEKFAVSFEAMKDLLRRGKGFRSSVKRNQEGANLAGGLSQKRVDIPPSPSATTPIRNLNENAPRVNSRPSRPVVAASSKQRRPNSYAAFLQQLVVSLVCEPVHAQALCEVLDLITDGQVTAAASGDKDGGNIRSFIEEVASGAIAEGLAEATAEISIEQREIWKSLLEKHGLDSELILEEAFRQIKIGGTESWRLVEETARITERHSLIAQVRTLRQAETQPTDSGGLLDLVQEKLKRKRALDNLNRSRTE